MAQKRREKIFSEYPDVVTVKQMCVMLGGISMKTAYKMLECGDIRHLKIGKSFKIPKVCIIEYLVPSSESMVESSLKYCSMISSSFGL